mmetsp:Transcript_11505/g.32301  ORF Transcript_11505/g.32301 Transcript_11505/m.32301 type:complete len:235 (+) Transcript_11505:1168-1872(+)
MGCLDIVVLDVGTILALEPKQGREDKAVHALAEPGQSNSIPSRPGRRGVSHCRDIHRTSSGRLDFPVAAALGAASHLCGRVCSQSIRGLRRLEGLAHDVVGSSIAHARANDEDCQESGRSEDEAKRQEDPEADAGRECARRVGLQASGSRRADHREYDHEHDQFEPGEMEHLRELVNLLDLDHEENDCGMQHASGDHSDGRPEQHVPQDVESPRIGIGNAVSRVSYGSDARQKR